MFFHVLRLFAWALIMNLQIMDYSFVECHFVSQSSLVTVFCVPTWLCYERLGGIRKNLIGHNCIEDYKTGGKMHPYR